MFALDFGMTLTSVLLWQIWASWARAYGWWSAASAGASHTSAEMPASTRTSGRRSRVGLLLKCKHRCEAATIKPRLFYLLSVLARETRCQVPKLVRAESRFVAPETADVASVLATPSQPSDDLSRL
jgi:hypothetical protein